MKDIVLRKGDLDDLAELQQLYADTISNVCRADYSAEQIDVWISGIKNKKRWQEMLTTQFVLVARDNDKIIGFCTLDNGNYIDFMYIHKDYQRQGIAKTLYSAIEKEARRQGKTGLTSDISKTARPFFEKVGFRVINEQTVEKQNIKLTNYKMAKQLT